MLERAHMLVTQKDMQQEYYIRQLWFEHLLLFLLNIFLVRLSFIKMSKSYTSQEKGVLDERRHNATKTEVVDEIAQTCHHMH